MSYYELFQLGPAVYIPILLLSLAITVVAYSAVPLIIAKTRKSSITKKKYRGLCYGINIVVMFLFIIINGEASSGGAYFLWTTVFSSVGMKTLSRRGIIADGEYLKDDPNRITECKSCGYQDRNFFNACPKCGKYAKQYIYLDQNSPADTTKSEKGLETPNLDIDTMSPKEAAEYLFAEQLGEKYIPSKSQYTPQIKTKYCSQCGAPIDNETKKCTGCGKQYFRGLRFPKFSVAIVILVLIIAVLSTVCILQHLKLEKTDSTNQAKIDKLENKIDALEDDLLNYKDLASFVDEYVVFVEDDGTDYYHKYECYKFKGDYFWAYNIDAAKGNGYTACPYCH